MSWKKLLIPLASVPVILLLAYGFRTDPKAIPSPLVQKAAPEFRLKAFDGGEVSLAELGTEVVRWYDIVSGVEWMADEGNLYVSLEPYGVVWLEPFRKGLDNLGLPAR